MIRNTRRPTLEPLESRTLLATCHVTRLGDFGAGADIGGGHWRGDLRFCITKANVEPGPDVIAFSRTGVINLSGPLPDVASDIDVQGPGAELLTIRRNSGGDYRIFTVAAGTVAISDLTITNGNADVGGGIYNQSTLTLDGVVVNSNTSIAGQGGGIYNSANLSLTASTITDNLALAEHDDDAFGGGIFNLGTLSALNSVISANEVNDSDSSFGDGYGGGIFNAASGSVTAGFTAIGDNRTYGTSVFGAGVYNLGALSVSDSTISENWLESKDTGGDTNAEGGGIYNAGDLVLDRSLLWGNSAYACIYAPGIAEAIGGGVAQRAGTATIFNSTIVQNWGLSYSDFSPPLLRAHGGGIAILGGSMTIAHSTIAKNVTTGEVEYGGGIEVVDAVLHMRNTVVSGNVAFNDAPDLSGLLTTSGYNLIKNSDGGSGYAPTDILDVDPMLASLANNGGPTQTMALLPGSPAIDAGDNTDAPEWDQRGPGFPRIVNGRIDIGAYEVQATAPTPHARRGSPGSPDPPVTSSVRRGSPDPAYVRRGSPDPAVTALQLMLLVTADWDND
jgi:hypothetical protein